MTKIATSFSPPGGKVLLLPWPTQELLAASPTADAVVPQCSVHLGDEFTDALTALADTGRQSHVVHLAPDNTGTESIARPHRTDRLTDRRGSARSTASTPSPDNPRRFANRIQAPTADLTRTADLVITSLRPNHSDTTNGTNTDPAAADHVALLAARLLRTGGILIVLTHCDWTKGALVDPTGAVVTAGQNADLLYLQHILAVHAPVDDGRFALTPSDETEMDEARSRHRAAVRGLPAPHRRIHSDVLVFAQPHDSDPPQLPPAPTAAVGPAESAFETGVIR